MTSRFNVNVFMCEYADENVTNIKNICDTIKSVSYTHLTLPT